MARVIVSPGLRDRFAGAHVLEIEARSVRELIACLDASAPGFAAEVEAQLAIVIDGEIYNDAWLEALNPDSEVHFLPRIRGGC